MCSSITSSTNSRSEEHTSELQSLAYLVCRLLLEKKKGKNHTHGGGAGELRMERHRLMGCALGGIRSRRRRQSTGRRRDLFFFNDPAPTEIYTLSLHDALPIWTFSDHHQARVVRAFTRYRIRPGLAQAT